MRLLIINPGSTSTKIAVFEDMKKKLDKTWRRSFNTKKLILGYLARKGIDIDSFDAIVTRGGLLRPMKSGTYRVTKKMVEDLESNRFGKHPSNSGAIIAFEIGKKHRLPAFIVNPVVVDELHPLARISGLPQIKRKSIFHALNQKMVAEITASRMNKKYNEANFIVAHLGGGISIGAHSRGKVIDVNNALDGEGPFSPERSGSLPCGDLVRLCFSGKFSKNRLLEKICGKGGLKAHLGTKNAEAIQKRIKNGDKKALVIFQALAYQVAKQIGAMATVLKGKIDAIILTGDLARSKMLVNWIKERIKFLADVKIYPGNEEMQGLALGVLKAKKILRY
jgi:butyrate kinase